MRMPWEDKTGLPQAAALFATLLLISLGLCGINLVISAHSSSVKGTTGFIIVTGFIESLGILVGVLGLAAVSLIGISKMLWDAFHKREDDPRR